MFQLHRRSRWHIEGRTVVVYVSASTSSTATAVSLVRSESNTATHGGSFAVLSLHLS